jgi:hypothetical protein
MWIRMVTMATSATDVTVNWLSMDGMIELELEEREGEIRKKERLEET